MAGRTTFAKRGLTMPEGNRLASNQILAAAAKSYHAVIADGGSDAGAKMAARATARGLGMGHDGSRDKAMGKAAHTRLNKPASAPAKADLSQWARKRGKSADMSRYQDVLDKMRDEGITSSLMSDLRAIRNQRSQEQNRSGLQGDFFSGFDKRAAQKPAAAPAGRMSDAAYSAAVKSAGVKTAKEYQAERRAAIGNVRDVIRKAREARAVDVYYDKRPQAPRLINTNDNYNLRDKISAARKAVRSVSEEARVALFRLPNAALAERRARGDADTSPVRARLPSRAQVRPELPQTKAAKLDGPQTIRPKGFGADVQSIASSGGLHVHEMFGHRAKGQFQITHADTGKRVLSNMSKTEAIAALRGMRTGRTASRLAAGDAKAEKATARYAKLLQLREAAKRAKPAPSPQRVAREAQNRAGMQENTLARTKAAFEFDTRTPAPKKAAIVSEMERSTASAKTAASAASQAASGAKAARAEIAAMSHTEIVRNMTDLQRVKPRPIGKMFGKSPTPEQAAKHAEMMREWTRKYSAYSRVQKAALERDNAAYRASNGG